MATLSMEARQAIKSYWAIDLRPVTIAGFTRSHFANGAWLGDACGCTDDRCIGYHHDETDECDCLPYLLSEYADAAAAARSAS